MNTNTKSHVEEGLVSSGESVARFVIILTSVLSVAVIGFAFLILPETKSRALLLGYHAIIVGSSLFIPIIPRVRGWSYRLHLYVSGFHYIGVHAYYLYLALGSESEVSRLYPMTLLYGLILTSLLAHTVSSGLIAFSAVAYFLMAAVSVAPFYDSTIMAWLVTLLVGEIFVCYLKFHSERVRDSLVQAVHERERELATSEALRMQAMVDQANVRLSAVKEATQHFAHDVRKPFALLDLFLDAVQQEVDVDLVSSVVNRYGAVLHSASKRATGHISDLLEFDTTNPPETAEVRLDELIREALDMVFFGKSPKDIDFEYGAGLVSILLVNEYKFVRVLINIIDNAQQAMSGKGTIRFRAEEAEPGLVRILIGNTNSEILSQDLDKLFEPFFTKGKSYGTGLGLAVCRKIIEAHGGSVSCSSESNYTEFALKIPGVFRASDRSALNLPDRFTSPASPGTDSCAVKIGRERPLILIVDDDPFILEQWENAMIDADVVTASSTSEFWAMYGEFSAVPEQVTAVIVDFYLDDSDCNETGLRLASRLRKEGFDRPIILSTHKMFDNGSLGVFDRVIDKSPKLWSEIFALIDRKTG